MQKDEIKQQIAQFTKIPIESIKSDKEITELVADSFMLVELLLSIQEQFQIELEQEDLEQVFKVGELLDLIVSKQPQLGITQVG